MRKAWIAAAAALLSFSARADEILLKNGDRLTGDIVRMDEGTVCAWIWSGTAWRSPPPWSFSTKPKLTRPRFPVCGAQSTGPGSATDAFSFWARCLPP